MMPISLKDDPGSPLHPTGMAPQLLLAIVIVHSVMCSRGLPLVVTSLNDGKHGAHSARHPRSLHYEGCAFDFRLPSRCGATQGTDAAMLLAIRGALGGEHSDYDVVLEGDHFHVEYDPKSMEAACQS